MQRRAPRRGKIWSGCTPEQPDDPHQPRPVLVVSEDVRNRLRDNVIVIPIFSRGRLGPTHVRLHAGTGGIRHDSVLFCEEISTIVVRFLTGGPFGPAIPDSVLEQVLHGVRRALGETLPEV